MEEGKTVFNLVKTNYTMDFLQKKLRGGVQLNRGGNERNHKCPCMHNVCTFNAIAMELAQALQPNAAISHTFALKI